MHPFNSALYDENEKIVIVAGGGGKSTLISRLAEYGKSRGEKILVCSPHDMYPPPETNIYLTKSTQNINTMLRSELNKSLVIYLGRNLDKDILGGFNSTEFKKHIPSLDADHIFIESDHTNNRSLSGFDRFQIPALKEIQRCIIVIGADCLNKRNDPVWLQTADPFWQDKEIIDPVDLADWFLKSKQVQKLISNGIPVSVFINKVEDIFHKNLAISLSRQLKLGGIDRVVYGSIFNAEFSLIK